MDILGERKFVEIPGDRTHELPPLLVRSTPVKRMDKMMHMAEDIISTEEILSNMPVLDPRLELEFERRRMDLALNLVDQYQTFMHSWAWGDSILEWIRQCETTFENRADLRPLLKADVWPHAGRKSFVVLLEDKAKGLLANENLSLGVNLEGAVGLRLTFRQPPPISCFSDQFLFYLNGSLAQSAFTTWASMNRDPVSDLPPERFRFDVVTM